MTDKNDGSEKGAEGEPDEFLELVFAGPVRVLKSTDGEGREDAGGGSVPTWSIDTLARTKADAIRLIEARVRSIVELAEADLNCGQYPAAVGGAREFDYMVEFDPPRKVLERTMRHGTRRRWLASATVLVGCFDPGAHDDPADDPEDDDAR